MFRNRLFWLIVGAVFLVGAGLYFNAAKDTLSAYDKDQQFLPILVVAALADSINPCAFSVLLLTIGFLFSIGRTRSNILLVGSTYVLGIFTVYLLIGLGILGTLQFFGTPHVVAKIGAFVIVLFGLLNVIEVYFPNFPVKLRIPKAAHGKMGRLLEKTSFVGTFLLGGFVGLVEFPCTGGPYLAILALLHDGATYAKGFAYLVLYNIIFILPLMVILFISSERSLLEKVQQWQKQEQKGMRLATGLVLILLGVVIFLF